MNIKSTLLALCLLILYTGIKGQAPLEYYVDISQASNGNGTSGSPWNRIWYAINRSPRDTTKDAIVYIKGGNYTIDFLIVRQGLATEPLPVVSLPVSAT